MAKKFYITTSIPYTNSPPHIGFALELVQADVIARYYRQQKRDVFFLTGTDEHGSKIAKIAKEKGKDPLAFAEEISNKFKSLTKILNISNSDFIRTTDEKRHLPAVYKLLEIFKERGDIYKKSYKGFYCSGCEAFKVQKELEDGKCVIHQKPVEIVEEENYFFKLSKYFPQIKKIIEKEKIKIIPSSKKTEVLNMIKEGLEDLSISRVKEKYWGWPFPGDETQNLYVWVDALSNYISALGFAENGEKFKKYWPADIHFIGKDIVKFHLIYWPAFLLSAKLPLPKNVFVHGFLTVNGQKISKSLGNAIDPFSLVEKYGADAVRYFLLREIPPTDDGDFSYEKFNQRYTADLASGLGNLVSRFCGLRGKEVLKPQGSLKTKQKVRKIKNNLKKLIENFRFNDALSQIWELVEYGNHYITKERLWENKDKKSLDDLSFLLYEISDLISPFLPDTAERIKRIIESGKKEILFPRVI